MSENPPAAYPKEQQNPPVVPGARPEDQPAPRQRVPDHYRQEEGDPRGIDSGWEPGKHMEGFQEAAREDEERQP